MAEQQKMAECCEDARRHIAEYPNDQHAFPGFRHMRLKVLTWDGSLQGCIPVFYCPWCGTKFEDPDARLSG